MSDVAIEIPDEDLAILARRWRVAEIALFGSVTRDDFDPRSDVDVLVTFEQGAEWSLWEFLDLKDELEKLLGRTVDLVEKRALRNPYRKRNILDSAKVVYAA